MVRGTQRDAGENDSTRSHNQTHAHTDTDANTDTATQIHTLISCAERLRRQNAQHTPAHKHATRLRPQVRVGGGVEVPFAHVAEQCAVRRLLERKEHSARRR